MKNSVCNNLFTQPIETPKLTLLLITTTHTYSHSSVHIITRMNNNKNKDKLDHNIYNSKWEYNIAQKIDYTTNYWHKGNKLKNSIVS